jgi:transposase-like protein
MPRPRKPSSPFRYFNSSPEIIRLAVMMYGPFPLSLRNVEDLLFERGSSITFGARSTMKVKFSRATSQKSGIKPLLWHC